MLNKIVIVGRLTKQPQLTAKEESDIVYFSVAVDFINCKAFGKIARNIASYTQKGSLVGIIGYMHSYKYEKDNQTHFGMELVVETIKFISHPNDNSSCQFSSHHAQTDTLMGEYEGSPSFDAIHL
ncbi:single-stranded DNA-binding protein [Staphylococcus simulans]|uniref:single-stranded DNA-binding protein n=1 Tax=Staphylococcus simulans TaxID=1286 RepID=UPI000D1D2861|nr:single-stranded DNA-binding protein [Staphylococcus simulans]